MDRVGKVEGGSDGEMRWYVLDYLYMLVHRHSITLHECTDRWISHTVVCFIT